VAATRYTLHVAEWCQVCVSVCVCVYKLGRYHLSLPPSLSPRHPTPSQHKPEKAQRRPNAGVRLEAAEFVGLISDWMLLTRRSPRAWEGMF